MYASTEINLFEHSSFLENYYLLHLKYWELYILFQKDFFSSQMPVQDPSSISFCRRYNSILSPHAISWLLAK